MRPDPDHRPSLVLRSSIELVGDLIFDVGLHRGEDSAFYLAKGYRVVAFEANPDLVASCRRRFAAEIADGRMTIIEGAISVTDEPSVRFYKHPNTVWGTTEAAWADRNAVVAASEAVDVPVTNFADTLRATGMPYFMKIDIEGPDRHCLETVRSFIPRPAYVSLESEQENWSDLVAEFALLEELGYDRFAVVQQAHIPGAHLTTTTIDGRPLIFEFEPDASGPFGPDLPQWLTRDAALARYRRIFRANRLLGPSSLIRRTRLGRGLRGQAARITRRPLPGWYDTHAMRSAAADPSAVTSHRSAPAPVRQTA